MTTKGVTLGQKCVSKRGWKHEHGEPGRDLGGDRRGDRGEPESGVRSLRPHAGHRASGVRLIGWIDELQDDVIGRLLL